MNLSTQRELENTREKLRLLEKLHDQAVTDTAGDAQVRQAEIESLSRQIKELREEVARFEARFPVHR